MASALMIDNLDAETLIRLKLEADRRGVDPVTCATELLKESLQSVERPFEGDRTKCLRALAGTWSNEEAMDFLAAVEDFDHIDPELWK